MPGAPPVAATEPQDTGAECSPDAATPRSDTCDESAGGGIPAGEVSRWPTGKLDDPPATTVIEGLMMCPVSAKRCRAWWML